MNQKFYEKILDIIGISGILISAYLLYVHYLTYNDPTGVSGLCKINSSMNCETNSLSSWSIMFGVPVAFWAMAYFGANLFLGALQGRTIQTVLSSAMLLASSFLSVLSGVHLGAFCPFCLLLNFFILIQFCYNLRQLSKEVRTRKQPLNPTFYDKLKNEMHISSSKLYAILPAFAAVGIVIMVYPKYWEMPQVNCDNVTCGVTEELHPYVESKTPPEVFIEEYSDYSCSNCLNGQRLIRNLIAKGARARLIHKNYPLSSNCNPLIADSPLHQLSCAYALWTIGALRASGPEAFWRANDLIFTEGARLDIEKIATISGQNLEEFKKYAETEESARRLALDIFSGIKLNISGTPAYFVNGKKSSFPEIVAKLKATRSSVAKNQAPMENRGNI